MSSGNNHFLELGQGLFRQPGNLFFPSTQVNHNPKADIIQNRGEQSRLDYFKKLDSKGISDNKGRRAHNRRHNLSTGGSCRLHRACKIILITQFAHQRNGKGSGCHNICRGRATDAPHQSAGQYRHLGRTAAGAARQGHRNIIKDRGHSGDSQKCAKQDKHVNERRGYS